MISRIHAATIVVSDQDKAIDFYVNILGWQKSADNPMGPNMRWVTVVPPGAETHLALAPPRGMGWAARTPGGETGIALIAPDLRGDYAALTAKGVRFKGEPESMPWGDTAAWFYDPDGNEFFLNEEAKK
jgi:catechol 2,3-dioxygenase-like lactoylglutathione lyase family enzyme